MDGTYAPQSPDLSSFLATPARLPATTQQQHSQLQHQQQQSRLQQQHYPSSYNRDSYGLFTTPHQSPYYSAQAAYQQSTDPAPPAQHSLSQQGLILTAATAGSHEYANYAPTYASPVSSSLQTSPSTYGQPGSAVTTATSATSLFPPSAIKAEDSYYNYRPNASFNGTGDGYYAPSLQQQQQQQTPQPRSAIPAMSSHFTQQQKSTGSRPSSSNQQQQPQQPARPTITYRKPNPNNIEVRTKFPVARIKRIMQADEEVGKVAQVTPVAVSKALELFMIALVSGAADKARENGGKRVTAQHLKMVVQGDDQFDFLGDIVGKVADGPEAGSVAACGEAKKRKGGNGNGKMESSDTEEDKKVRKGKSRRKKNED